MPRGVRFDLGGVGKGLAADLLAEGLIERGARSACISLGGDIRAAGLTPDGLGWQIPIEDPFGSDSVMGTVPVAEPAIVTSTTLIRTWRRGGKVLHHLVDPRTGDPSSSGIVAAVVMAPEGWLAEGLAKAALVAGVDRGTALLEGSDVAGWLACADGSILRHGRRPRAAVQAGRQLMDAKFWWYASRASGLVLWVLVATSVVWGFAVSAKLVRRRGLPAWMLDLHKHLAWLSVVFTAAHLVALWADNYVHFGPAELFVPMASSWRPGAVTWGIVAFYLLALVQITSWLMRRLPRKVWHAVHFSSLPLLVTGTVHGITAGADWGNRAVLGGLLVGFTSVVWIATFRVLGGRKPATGDRLAAARAARDALRSPAEDAAKAS